MVSQAFPSKTTQLVKVMTTPRDLTFFFLKDPLLKWIFFLNNLLQNYINNTCYAIYILNLFTDMSMKSNCTSFRYMII